MPLILASASSIRRAMLDAAGVAHDVDPGRVDESALKAGHDGDDAALATMLAAAKAAETSARRSKDWIIGGDSLISVDGRRFDKPDSRDAAAEHLRFFSGKAMRLTSAVALARDGRIDWSHAAEAMLHVRPLSEDFIHTYLEAEWPAVGGCVGVFRMEGRGVTLFETVEGDHFTILGMPLLPLLGALRQRRLMAVMTSAWAEVIGDPVAQSKSPAIYRFWFDALGIDGDYRATTVSRAGLGDHLARRRADPAWRGCNVTMPLKLDALLAADGASDLATAAGAANLLVLRDGHLIAGNTDVTAVRTLLTPIAATGAITLLGNGGAARAVLLALKLIGAGPVVLQSRNMAAATALAVEFGLGEGPRPFTAGIDSRGLINATPVGMTGIAATAIDLSAMPGDGWVFDLVSGPLPTPLLAKAEARGLTTIDGLTMLVEQAADSFEAMFGAKPPRDRDAELLASLRA